MRAAELRAVGSTWPTIAAHVGRSVRTLHAWRVEHAACWTAAYRRAERELVDEAAAESVLMLRTQLRAKSEAVRQSAAQKLLAYRQARERQRRPAARKPDPRPKPSSLALRIATYLETLSEDEHDRLLERVLPIATAHLDRRRAGRGGGGA